MKIDILCTDGSPLGVSSKTIWGDSWRVGVGGAELALLTMAELWHEQGHQVRIFNNPKENDASPFLQAPRQAYNVNEDRDIAIFFRTPNLAAERSKGLKIWWSCDQQTSAPFRAFSPLVHKIVCISPFHAEYFKSRYGIADTIVIDLPVRAFDYDEQKIDKVPNRVIFTSVPDRGLELLARIWPSIYRSVPDASLVITSDYRLWGADALNERFRMMFLQMPSVHFLGAVPRKQLIQEQLSAECLAYPCTYEELFCYTVAEASYVGAWPITSDRGSLATTNMSETIHLPFGAEMRQMREFGDRVVDYLKLDPNEKRAKEAELRQKVIDRMSPEAVLAKWESEVFN